MPVIKGSLTFRKKRSRKNTKFIQITSIYGIFARFCSLIMMVLRQKRGLRGFLNTLDANHSLGLVPTMGALHLGHLSLIKKALVENKTVIISIFINPTQFDNRNDLEKYPADLEKDIALLEDLPGDLAVFAPHKDDMYDGQVAASAYKFNGLDKVMEGTFREGHFQGVATIVELLLRTVAPKRAYFGEKDFQQLQIIKNVVAQKNLPVTIVGCPIVREPNGLAMSSRNERLSAKARDQAGFIHQTLLTAKLKFGTENAQEIRDWALGVFNKAEGFRLEYFEIVDETTLTPIQAKQKNLKYRAFVAVYVEDVRLIDNMALN